MRRNHLRLLAGAGAIGLLLGAIGALAQVRPAARATPALQRGGQSVCGCEVYKSLSSDTIRLCDTSTVEIGVWPACPGTPIHIVLIIDEVYKPNYSNPRDRTQALRQAVRRLEMRAHPNVRVGVVWMQNGSAITKLELTNDENRVVSVLDVPEVSRFQADIQCFDCGFREAIKIMNKGAKDFPDAEIHEIFLLAPLGVYTPAAAPSVTKGARMAKARQAQVISTCFAWTHCDTVLRLAASQPRLYLAFGEGNRLAALLADVVDEASEAFVRTVTIEERFPPGLRPITDSFSVAPKTIDLAAGLLTWEFEQPIAQAYTVTYALAPEALGTYALGPGSRLRMIDSNYRDFEAPLPVRALTVSEECPSAPTPTPVPSPTPSPTARPSATASRTPIPTPVPPTPTATPEPTPLPGPIYLPVILGELCQPARTVTHVALVLDMSTSMLQRHADGRPKLVVAQEAARLFLSGLHFQPEASGISDRMAIVGFNHAAWIQQPLSQDPIALEAAIQALPEGMREHSRLDLAFERGAEALRGVPAGADTTVLVVLTDGMPNQVPYAEDGTMETTVLRQAAAAKAAGIGVYTIGLGRSAGPDREINADLLRAAASTPGMYYEAPDAGRLAEIYGRLTRLIPCGGGRYWPEPPAGTAP
ncbi:MAG: VWA domain-containing protein [Caldilineae bacterium]|nr:VWA domain-containing protein [Caldilineae bacterium]